MSVMMSCGLPQGHGCGRCDTCRNPDGTYASGPGERWLVGLLLWTSWAIVSFAVGGIVYALSGWDFWYASLCTFGTPFALFVLFLAVGPM
jgi:hypothetical protein